MVVHGTGQYDGPLSTWEKIRDRFDVRKGHGKCAAWRFNKQNFMPPDMCVSVAQQSGVGSPVLVCRRLINVVYESPAHAPVVAEIQIHYRPILELKVGAFSAYDIAMK